MMVRWVILGLLFRQISTFQGLVVSVFRLLNLNLISSSIQSKSYKFISTTTPPRHSRVSLLPSLSPVHPNLPFLPAVEQHLKQPGQAGEQATNRGEISCARAEVTREERSELRPEIQLSEPELGAASRQESYSLVRS